MPRDAARLDFRRIEHLDYEQDNEHLQATLYCTHNTIYPRLKISFLDILRHVDDDHRDYNTVRYSQKWSGCTV